MGSSARRLSTQIMKESSLAILLLSLGCLLSIAPVQGRATCPVCPVCSAGDDAAEEGDAEGDGGDGDEGGDKDGGEEGGEGDEDGGAKDAKKEKEGCEIEEKTDYLGHDMKGSPHKAESQEACAKLTASKKGGLFWTYRDSDKKCWIKTSKKGKKANKKLVSGNRECGV